MGATNKLAFLDMGVGALQNVHDDFFLKEKGADYVTTLDIWLISRSHSLNLTALCRGDVWAFYQ